MNWPAEDTFCKLEGSLIQDSTLIRSLAEEAAAAKIIQLCAILLSVAKINKEFDFQLEVPFKLSENESSVEDLKTMSNISTLS